MLPNNSLKRAEHELKLQKKKQHRKTSENGGCSSVVQEHSTGKWKKNHGLIPCDSMPRY